MATRRGTAHAPQSAYVLHHHDWSESSLIVELFTRTQGRVVVAAKGAKRPTSNFRAVLLHFQPLWVVLGKAPPALPCIQSIAPSVPTGMAGG